MSQTGHEQRAADYTALALERRAHAATFRTFAAEVALKIRGLHSSSPDNRYGRAVVDRFEEMAAAAEDAAETYELWARDYEAVPA